MINSNNVILSIKTELKHHPKSQLPDIYKYLVQSYLGANHANVNYNKALVGIKNELSQKQNNDALFCALGTNPKFYRVNLKVISQNIINITTFTSFFCKTTKIKTSCNFNLVWDIAKTYLQTIFLAKDIINFEENNKNNLSHSKIYKQSYNPHYRVICKQLISEFV